MVAVIGLILGILLGLLLQPSVPSELQPYLPIAVVAALDALLGALRARLEDVFDDRVFITSFLFNVLIAAFLVFLGDQLGVGSQLSTAVVVVLGIRIFSNAAAIRRHVFKA
ncbi:MULTISPECIES: small basic family protein [unclassified Pseudactinotalea]|uniref:small basic family protein n=1 Tax=Micrococcales TaxID=85006 RepID=UPI003C7BF93A